MDLKGTFFRIKSPRSSSKKPSISSSKGAFAFDFKGVFLEEIRSSLAWFPCFSALRFSFSFLRWVISSFRTYFIQFQDFFFLTWVFFSLISRLFFKFKMKRSLSKSLDCELNLKSSFLSQNLRRILLERRPSLI